MKRITIISFLALILPVFLIAQSATWPVKAMKGGKEMPVNAYFEDGTVMPVIAIYEEGNDHFMDVKVIRDGSIVSIKLVSSNEMLVPVKGITSEGTVVDIKAEDASGELLDVKGVSRDGNTTNIAAVNIEGREFMLKAISPAGVTRDVKGVKFNTENVEMEFGDLLIIGHVKALPTIEIGDVERQWPVSATASDGTIMEVLAINSKGREYSVKAKMSGKMPYLMNVKGDASIEIAIKLILQDHGVILAGIDEFGRMYDVKAKTPTGTMYPIIGGQRKGNVVPIYAVGEGDEMIPLKARASNGYEFDVKGLKVKEDEVEGIISGLNVWIRYFAHVKALAPASANMKEN